jgi:hypothetical protein
MNQPDNRLQKDDHNPKVKPSISAGSRAGDVSSNAMRFKVKTGVDHAVKLIVVASGDRTCLLRRAYILRLVAGVG